MVLIQWHNHGEEVLANTLRIREVQAIPPISGGEADGGGGIAWTSKDEEGIRQYLRAMVMPLTLYYEEK